MKNKIDVSIIIPAYNAAATVGCLVNKILSEPHVAIEPIVVDEVLLIKQAMFFVKSTMTDSFSLSRLNRGSTRPVMHH